MILHIHFFVKINYFNGLFYARKEQKDESRYVTKKTTKREIVGILNMKRIAEDF